MARGRRLRGTDVAVDPIAKRSIAQEGGSAMKRQWVSVLSIAVVAPMAVDMNARDPDSTATSLMIGAGAGSYAYVTRGCEGEVLDREQLRFRDAGMAVTHRFNGPVELGLRATMLRKMPQYEKNTVIWNPNASFEGRKVGFGLGVNLGGESKYDHDFEISPVSGHLRLGPRRTAYFSTHVFEDVPLVSGGAPVRMGLGFRGGSLMDGWLGVGFPAPSDKAGFVAKADLHLNRSLDVNLTGRLGESEGLSENAGAVGITLRRSHVDSGVR